MALYAPFKQTRYLGTLLQPLARVDLTRGSHVIAFLARPDVMAWTAPAPAELCDNAAVVGPRLGVGE